MDMEMVLQLSSIESTFHLLILFRRPENTAYFWTKYSLHPIDFIVNLEEIGKTRGEMHFLAFAPISEQVMPHDGGLPANSLRGEIRTGCSVDGTRRPGAWRAKFEPISLAPCDWADGIQTSPDRDFAFPHIRQQLSDTRRNERIRR
jgi:hypothetical protein